MGYVSLLCVALAGCSAAQGAVPAWRRTVLVELFTSQGCSSCPAADTFIKELPALGLGPDKVVPLTFHVDYWDGLGWKDRFAKPEFTARQEWYARSTSLRSPDGETGLHGLYTPQLVVDGAVHLSGRRRQEATREMERASTSPPLFDLTPSSTVNGVVMDVDVGAVRRPGVPPSPEWRLTGVLTTKRARTAVASGENSAETLKEAAIVRVLSDPIPLPANPGGTTRVRLVRPADAAWADLDMVVFVQSRATGMIAAAVQRSAITR